MFSFFLFSAVTLAHLYFLSAFLDSFPLFPLPLILSLSASITLATPHVSDVYLQLLEAGRLSDVAGCVVGDAVASTHRVVVVAITHNVAHAAGNRNARVNSVIIRVTAADL